MVVNPLIFNKIEQLSVPPKVKQLLKRVLEVEEQLEVTGTKKDHFRNYDHILDSFVKDDEIIKFCNEHDQSQE